MESISVKKYLENGEPSSMIALMKVFKDSIFPMGGATNCPFQNAIEARSLLFAHGSRPFWDNPIFWDSLSSAILEIGDTEIFAINALVGYYSKYVLSSDNPLPNLYSTYIAISSLRGTWGILFDMDGIGVIGGSTTFIDNIRKYFPEIDAQFANLLIDWRNNDYVADNEWLPNTLEHIYGEVKGKELLEEARKMNVYFDLIYD